MIKTENFQKDLEKYIFFHAPSGFFSYNQLLNLRTMTLSFVLPKIKGFKDVVLENKIIGERLVHYQIPLLGYAVLFSAL
jgi:hypothetical protein